MSESELSMAELADLARAGMSEVRTVNDETGGEKGTKLFRYDLIPAHSLKELALLYGLGATKYTKSFPVDAGKALSDMERSCTCNDGQQNVTPTADTQQKGCASNVINRNTQRHNEQSVIQTASSIVEDCVNRVMTDGSKNKTRNTLKDSGLSTKIGWRIIAIGNSLTTKSTKQGRRVKRGKQLGQEKQRYLGSASLGKMINWFKSVKFVKGHQTEDGLTSTTTMKPENSVDFCVENATKDLDSFKMIQDYWNQHSNTCNVRNYIKFSIKDGQLIETTTGDRNWERGYEWSKSFGALQRHAWAWWEGETFDAETNVSHMTNVAWHAFALVHFEKYATNLDDRPTNV